MGKEFDIPKEVIAIAAALERGGFEAYVVGGCVRDMFLGREAEDWDVATNARPEEIQALFPDNFYENKFFTVTVQTGSNQPKLANIEVTTFRAEFGYGDRRHPEDVRYAKTIEEDLSRRDFTVNAIALKIKRQKSRLPARQAKNNVYEIVDPFGGREDLKNKIIRAVGNPAERFQEDALRMLRAVRFVSTLGFSLEKETEEAIRKFAPLLKEISMERVRDEFMKMIASRNAARSVDALREVGLLAQFLGELEEGWEVGQNKHHIYTVWEHNVRALAYAAKQEWDPLVRLASLLHDVGKPRTKEGDGPDSTFYNHEMVGARMAREILSRLKFSKKDMEKVVVLVRYHLFYYNVGEVMESSVRRLLLKVGMENIEDLLKVRMADRIGSGVPKAEPYKLRHLRYLLDKVARDPISAKMLKVNGADIMAMLSIEPGPRVGAILDALLAEVLDDSKRNAREWLEGRAKELALLSDEELALMRKRARLEKDEAQEEVEQEAKQKYWVR
ncbi:MAG: HD domain-containing protein [Candidatus Wildermuthbacteria bacterium]|nr:HD domain-containing protein [Candidatus Wildermuthbacteria bacterium]